MSLVLVVDDSEDNLLVLQHFLLNLGHQCRLATSGQMALELLLVETFDLILTDLQMADGDGIWLLNEVKKMAVVAKCVLLTSERSNEVDFYLNQGFADVCFRPLDFKKLESVLKHFVK